MPNEDENSQFEMQLFGGFRALGLVASPRVDGSGVTFACRCAKSRLELSKGSVSCPACGFSASGEAWEIAAKCVPEKSAKAAGEGLPIRSLEDVLNYIPDPKEEIWPGGILSMGLPTAIVGAPGVGKSRITLQAAICTVLGLPFIDFPTHGPGLKWLFLQTENSMRRLQSDLSKMVAQFSKEQRDMVNDCIRFLDIGAKDFGSICMMDGHPDKLLILETLASWRADIIVIDPVRDAGMGDLNKDADMTATCKGITATIRASNPKATPFCVHHGRTGTVEASKVFGGDAGSFARNSKVLLGWLRSQINVASAGDNHPDTVIFGCGKCSDGPRWDPFAAKLDLRTMLYSRVNDFDLEQWGESMIEQSKRGKGATKASFSMDNMLACLSATEWVSGATWFAAASEMGCAKATFYRLVAKMQEHPKVEREGKIFRRRA